MPALAALTRESVLQSIGDACFSCFDKGKSVLQSIGDACFGQGLRMTELCISDSDAAQAWKRWASRHVWWVLSSFGGFLLKENFYYCGLYLVSKFFSPPPFPF